MKVADIYDWVCNLTTDIADATIKGELFGRKVPGIGQGTITAKRRVNTTAILAREALDSALLGEQLTYRLDLIDNQAGFTQVSGTAFVSSGSLTAPSEAVDETIELTMDGEPTWSVPGSS